MDERSVESSAAFTHLLEEEGKAKASRRREFTVLVARKNSGKPFSFAADTRQECADKLSKEYSVDLVKDKYAVGYFIGNSPDPMVYGNNAEIEAQLEKHLRNKR